MCQVLVEDQVKDRAKDQATGLAAGLVKDQVEDLVEGRAVDQAEDQAKGQAMDRVEDRVEDQAEDRAEDQARGQAMDQHLHHKVLPQGQHKPRPTSNLRCLCRGSNHRHTSCNHLCLVHCSRYPMTQPYTFLLKPSLEQRREVY